MLDNPRDFLGIFLSPPLIVFFRGAVSLSSLSSELSGARLRQLYRRPRERFAVDNRNRLQTFRMAPATISTFPASSISRYILFPRAFPPATTNNTSADVDRVATTSCRQSYCPPGEPATAPSLCPRSRAMTIVRLRNDGEDNEDDEEMPVSSWKISWFCRNLSPSPTIARSTDFLSFQVFLLLYLRFLSPCTTWLCMQIRARKSANMMDRVDELPLEMNAFLFIIFFYDVPRSISPFLSRSFPSFCQCIQHISLDAHWVFFIVTFRFISAAMRS